jgi:hypothetical protein
MTLVVVVVDLVEQEHQQLRRPLQAFPAVPQLYGHIPVFIMPVVVVVEQDLV